MQTARAGAAAIAGALVRLAGKPRARPARADGALSRAHCAAGRGGAHDAPVGEGGEEEVTLADLERAARFARIDVHAYGDGERLLADVRKALRSFRTIHDVPVDNVEPLHNMADFLARYRAEAGLEDAAGRGGDDDDGEALEKHELSREELLSLSNASVSQDQYHLPRT